MEENVNGGVKPSKKVSLFDAVWEKGKDAIKHLQKPIKVREIRLQFISAHDDLTQKIMKKESEINDLRADVANFDLKKVMIKRTEIQEHKEAQLELEKEYTAYLGENLKSRLD